IYVLRSLSTDPQIAGLKHLHKIGFSTTTVSERIKNAVNEPTYLMAPVEVVADYHVYNVRPSALERLIHRVFSDVRLSLIQVGPNGEVCNPSEWFIVPFKAIDQAIEMTVNGDITDFTYDPTSQSFIYAEHGGQ
ncbi:MAG: GIY-YIG nuclease family protein, partial [Pauljensenia sp.]